MKTILLVGCLISSTLWAAPKSLEVWFLSPDKKAALLERLQSPSIRYSALTAELECIEMGDKCFDPQYGLYEKSDENKPVSLKSKSKSVPHARSIDRNVIDCSGNYFDVFCGKAQADQAVAPTMEIWVDTSASMKEVDFPDKAGDCFRRSFLRRVEQSCALGKKMSVMSFDTSIKQLGSIEYSCQNIGLNDQKRMMDWIERSEAKHVVIITDAQELRKEFLDFLHSKKAKIKGDSSPLLASQLLELVDDLGRSCR